MKSYKEPVIQVQTLQDTYLSKERGVVGEQFNYVPSTLIEIYMKYKSKFTFKKGKDLSINSK